MKKVLYSLLIFVSFLPVSAMEPEDDPNKPLSHNTNQFIIENCTQTTLGHDTHSISEKQLPWDYLNAYNILENPTASEAEIKKALNILEFLAHQYHYAPAQHALANFIIHDQFNYKEKYKDPKSAAMNLLHQACQNHQYPPAQYLLSALLLQNSMRVIPTQGSSYQFKPQTKDTELFSSIAEQAGLAPLHPLRVFRPIVVTPQQLTLHPSSAFKPIQDDIHTTSGQKTSQKKTVGKKSKLSEAQEFINSCLLTHFMRNYRRFIDMVIEKIKTQSPTDPSTHELVTSILQDGVFEHLNKLATMLETASYACGLLCDLIAKLSTDQQSDVALTKNVSLNTEAKNPWIEKACDYYFKAPAIAPAQLRYAQIKLTHQISHKTSAALALQRVVISSKQEAEKEMALSLLHQEAIDHCNIEAAFALLELYADPNYKIENYEEIIIILSKFCRGLYKQDLIDFAHSHAYTALSKYAQEKNDPQLYFLLGKCFATPLITGHSKSSEYIAIAKQWLSKAAQQDTSAWWYLARFLLEWDQDLLALIESLENNTSFLTAPTKNKSRLSVLNALEMRAQHDGKAAYIASKLQTNKKQAAKYYQGAMDLGFWPARFETAQKAIDKENYPEAEKYLLPYLNATKAEDSQIACQAWLKLESIATDNLSVKALYTLGSYLLETDTTKALSYLKIAEERLKKTRYKKNARLVKTSGFYEKLAALSANNKDARTAFCLLHWNRAQRAQRNADHLENNKLLELEKVLELLPTISDQQHINIEEVFFTLGYEYEKQKQYALAVENYQKAHNHLSAMFQLGQLLVHGTACIGGKTKEESKQKGLQILDSVASYQSNTQERKELRGNAATLLAQTYLKTAESYESAQITHPAEPDSTPEAQCRKYRELAIGYLKHAALLEHNEAQNILAALKTEHEYLTIEEAYSALSEKAHNGDGLAAYKIGLTYYQNKSYTSAKNYFKRALEADPHLTIAKGYLADSLLKTDLDRERALKEALPLLKEFLAFVSATKENFHMVSEKDVKLALENLTMYGKDEQVSEIIADPYINYYAVLSYFKIYLITSDTTYLTQGDGILIELEESIGTTVVIDTVVPDDDIYVEANPIILEVFDVAEKIARQNNLYEFAYHCAVSHKIRYEWEVSLFENPAEHLTRALSLLNLAQKTDNVTFRRDIAQDYVSIGKFYLYNEAFDNPASAFKCFSQAEKIDPENTQATFLLGDLYLNKPEATDRPSEPSFGFDKMLAAANKGYAPACYQAAQYYLPIPNYSLAYKYLDSAVRSNHTKAMLLRTKLYLEKKDAKALSNAQQLIERILAKSLWNKDKVKETQQHILTIYRVGNLEQKIKSCFLQVKLSLKELGHHCSLPQNISATALWLNKAIDHAFEKNGTCFTKVEDSLKQHIELVQTRFKELLDQAEPDVAALLSMNLERISHKLREKNYNPNIPND